MGDLLILLLTTGSFLAIIVGVFYMLRRKRKKKEKDEAPAELNKKFVIEISTILSILLGVVLKYFFIDSWLIAGLIAGATEIVLISLINKKSNM